MAIGHWLQPRSRAQGGGPGAHTVQTRGPRWGGLTWPEPTLARREGGEPEKPCRGTCPGHVAVMEEVRSSSVWVEWVAGRSDGRTGRNELRAGGRRGRRDRSSQLKRRDCTTYVPPFAPATPPLLPCLTNHCFEQVEARAVRSSLASLVSPPATSSSPASCPHSARPCLPAPRWPAPFPPSRRCCSPFLRPPLQPGRDRSSLRVPATASALDRW